MLFNSIAFAAFLPIVFLLYWFVFEKSLKRQNLFLIIASYYFYGSWDWRFLLLIIVSSLSDYLIGIAIHNSESTKKRKYYLWLSIGINLGILCFFKYFNFFILSFSDFMSQLGINTNITSLSIILPVGISFYTFQTLSYTIDIYRERIEPIKNPTAFFAFVAFFPQLVAGPIERASNMLPQFLSKRSFSYPQAISGMRQILWGLFKKIVVADHLARIVDLVHNSPETYGSWSLLLVAFFFSIQVYCDFSAYSDIAIGVAKLFNFKLSENFRTPLFSKSIQELWTRWHISLSTWFRDYVYISLGGNKIGKRRNYINLMITFFLSGLWHGADWTFVIWGSLHGVYLIVEKILKINFKNFVKFLNHSRLKIGWNIFSVLLTFFLFSLSLVIFRSESVSDAIHYFYSFQFSELTINGFSQSILLIFEHSFEARNLFISLTILFLVDFFIRKSDLDIQLNKLSKRLRYSIYFILTIWMLYAGAFEQQQEFVYFQF